MYDTPSSRDLMLGALALRMKFLSAESLAAGLLAWSEQRERPLGEVLEQQGWLSFERQRLLESVAQQHTVRSPGDTPSVSAAIPHTHAPDEPETRPAAMRFRILRPHARGGLGQVSVALDLELRREVALKEIQEQCADDPDSRARFLLEAEITGGLEHPGIVPVYGAGRHLDGRPFYAMRFIRGESLEHAALRMHKEANLPGAEAHHSTLRRLVRRLTDACYAVAYAHSRGILHRDLKPANIMLGDFGETLVVDWGLARPFTPVTGSATRANPPLQLPALSALQPTQAGQAVGTPGFMSPEQAAGRLHLLGPRSDVYSLGVTLRRLLHDAAAPKPLQAICRKATAQSPDERYASAREMAEDLERWLADEPVHAEPEPVVARMGRWARRHKPWLAAAVMLLLGAVFVLAGATVAIAGARDDAEREREAAGVALELELKARKDAEQAQENAITERKAAQTAQQQAVVQQRNAEEQRQLALKQQREAEQERKKAQEEEQRTRQVADFFANLFIGGTPDPFGLDNFLIRTGKFRGDRLTAVEVLDQGTNRIGTLDKLPVIQASVLDALGESYRALAQFKQARELLHRALALRRQHLPPDHLDIANSLLHVARLEHDRGNYNDAQNLYEESLELQRRLLPADDPRLEKSELLLGWCLTEKRQFMPAEALFKGLLERRVKRLGEDHFDTAIVRLALAGLALEKGDPVTALAQSTRVLEGTLPNDARADAAKAFGLFQQAVAAKQSLFGLPANPARAEQHLRQVLAIAERFLPPNHPAFVLVRHELADALNMQGKDAEAGEQLRTCIDLLRQSVGLEHGLAYRAVNSAAKHLARHGKYDEGKALFDEMLNAQRERYGPDHEILLNGLDRAATLTEEYEDFPYAAAIGAENVHVIRRLGRLAPDALYYEGRALLWAGRLSDAKMRLEEAAELLRTRVKEPARGIAIYGVALADVHFQLGQFDQARQLVDASLAYFKTGKGVPLFPQVDALLLRSRLDRRQGDRAAAERSCEEALNLARRQKDDSLLLARALEARAGLHAEQDQHDRAAPLLTQAIALVQKRLGANSRPALRLQARLALVQLSADDLPAYRKLCADLFAAHSRTSDPYVAALLVRTCALGDAQPAAALVDLAWPAAWFCRDVETTQFALALALAGEGKAEEATRILEQYRTRSGGKLTASTEMLSALLHARAGRKNEAKQAIARVEELLKDKGSASIWHDTLETRKLRQEVDVLLK